MRVPSTILALGALAALSASSPAMAAPAADDSFHVIKPGQTLASIAQERLGASSRWQEIARLNNLQPPYKIAAGQKLRLPPAVIATPAAGNSEQFPAGQSRQAGGAGKILFFCGAGIIGLAALTGFVAFIWFEVVAFRQGFWWGVGVLLIHPVYYVFLAKFWDKAKRSFITQIIACVLAGAGWVTLLLSGITVAAATS